MNGIIYLFIDRVWEVVICCLKLIETIASHHSEAKFFENSILAIDLIMMWCTSEKRLWFDRDNICLFHSFVLIIIISSKHHKSHIKL